MTELEKLFKRLAELEEELNREFLRRKEIYSYTIKKKKIEFEKAVKLQHKKLATGNWKYLLTANPLSVLTAPIIYSILIPAFALDISVSLYQSICFPVYGIPKVKRSKYIIIDRQYLSYLNSIEKVNCMYCGYFNGLMAYITEVAARTEQYWCPIKHARHLPATHARYYKFLDYGDEKDFHERIRIISRDFEVEKEKSPEIDFQI